MGVAEKRLFNVQKSYGAEECDARKAKCIFLRPATKKQNIE